MKHVKKWAALATALAVSASTAACAKQETQDADKPASSAAASSGSGTSPSPQAPAKISMYISDHSQPVPAGKVMDDPTFKYLAQKTNTELSVEFLPHGQYADQLKIKYASGTSADVVQSWGIDAELYRNKKLLPLDELLDKYGPNLKKNIPKEAWEAVTYDGKIYGIPEGALGNAPSPRVIYVRKDWLDKVGITKVPATTDEFLDMLRAFRDKDPNGNGKKDEIPFTARENFTWIENITGMFGVTADTPVLVNGEVHPGIISAQMKEALGFIRTMVSEKLIDSEFMSNKRNVWEQKIQSDLAGSWNHTNDLAWDWQDRLNKSLPGKGANVIAIPTPKAPGVTHTGIGTSPFKKVFNITASAKNPEAIIKLFDWLASEEGQEFVNFGVPGVTFTKEGGQIKYDKQKDTDNKTITWRPTLLNLVGYNKELLKVQVGAEAAAKLDAAYAITQKEGIPVILRGTSLLTSYQKYPDLKPYGTAFLQMVSKITLGDQPIGYFDEFVKNWRAQGGNEIIKEMTDWYNANKK